MQKRIPGWKRVVLELIKENPNLTAKEYAEMALQSGAAHSASKNPVQSLATTLLKEVKAGRMPGIVATGRPMKFYSQERAGIAEKADKERADIIETTEMLVEVGKFDSRNDALYWLASEGIKAKKQELDHARGVLQDIKKLKESIHV